MCKTDFAKGKILVRGVAECHGVTTWLSQPAKFGGVSHDVTLYKGRGFHDFGLGESFVNSHVLPILFTPDKNRKPVDEMQEYML